MHTFLTPTTGMDMDAFIPDSWILDAIPVAIWVGRVPDGAAVYTNRAFSEIMGMEAVRSSRLADAPATYRIFDREGRVFPLDRVPFAQVIATGQPATSDEMVIHRSDGRKVPIRVFAQPVRDAAGTLTHVSVAFLDITRELEAERARAAAQERLKMVVDHAPMAFFTLDQHGVVTLSEGAGLKALGVAPGQLVGQSVYDLYRDYPLIIENLRRGLAGESFWSSAEVGEVSFDSWFAPLRDADGQVTGLVGVSNDVSELQRLRANTVQNARIVAMGTLAASVAHEINNPLTYAIASSLELGRMLADLRQRVEANEGPPGFDEWRRLLDRMSALQKPIQSGVERIASITRELRTYTRPDDDARTPIDLAALVGSVLRLFSKQVESRARLVATLGPTPTVPANESRLVQVVTNLLLNAAQVFDEGNRNGAIWIETKATGDKVFLTVADNGPGVPGDQRERIFEPFVTTKEVGQGTGLGLFVCRNIVRELGGQITVEDRPGGGALFRVELPVPTGAPQIAAAPTAPAAPEAEAEPEVAPRRAPAHVLLIDDDPLVVGALARQLSAAGITVDTVTEGARGIERLLSDQNYDLVFCDLMMKGVTGMDIHERLKAERPERLERVVFMTGGAFNRRAAAFLEQEGERCVEKPFDIVAEARRRLGRNG